MINGVELIDLPKIKDMRGNLSFFENNNQIPFDIKRTYWIYDVPAGEVMSGHAFKKSHELIVALSGSFNIVLNDGKKQFTYNLNRSYNGLYVPNLIWRNFENFSANGLVLIVSNFEYSSTDYIKNFEEFKNIIIEK